MKRWYYTIQTFTKFIENQEGVAHAVASTLLEHEAKQPGDLIVEEIEPHKFRLRRLTPIECIRLQGLPSDWISDVQGPDGAKFKMAGNGIAVPCAVDVLSRIEEAWRSGQ